MNSAVMASQTSSIPDKAGLAKAGQRVTARLEAHPSVYRLPTDQAEIFALGDFLNPTECEKMIALIDAVAKPSRAFETEYARAYRTSYSGDVDPTDPFVARVQRRIDDLLGMPPENGETVQGQRYLPGQEFRPHFDWFDTKASYWEEERSRGGQRCYTTMVFLNQVAAGGATYFPTLGMTIEPKPGVLLAWNNVTPGGAPSQFTLHAGNPVEEGVKYIITKWYRARKWR